jgi:hypothetical protein
MAIFPFPRLFRCAVLCGPPTPHSASLPFYLRNCPAPPHSRSHGGGPCFFMDEPDGMFSEINKVRGALASSAHVNWRMGCGGWEGSG